MNKEQWEDAMNKKNKKKRDERALHDVRVGQTWRQTDCYVALMAKKRMAEKRKRVGPLRELLPKTVRVIKRINHVKNGKGSVIYKTLNPQHGQFREGSMLFNDFCKRHVRVCSEKTKRVPKKTPKGTAGDLAVVQKMQKIQKIVGQFTESALEETRVQLQVRLKLTRMGITPTCRFGPEQYAKLEYFLTDLVIRNEGAETEFCI